MTRVAVNTKVTSKEAFPLSLPVPVARSQGVDDGV